MERIGSQAAPGSAPDDPREDGPAVRDAAAILGRAAADEAAAGEARDRYRTQRLQALEPDARIAPLLDQDEILFAVRRSVMLDRYPSRSGPDSPTGVGGDLYLTARRLVLLGRIALGFDLDEIEEAGLSGEHLLLVMRNGSSISLDAAEPRLLRVEIGCARAAAKG
ncbi:MAG: hypothetical protein ACYC65_07360 [Candidatus Limnocylindrales bacterium]